LISVITVESSKVLVSLSFIRAKPGWGTWAPALLSNSWLDCLRARACIPLFLSFWIPQTVTWSKSSKSVTKFGRPEVM